MKNPHEVPSTDVIVEGGSHLPDSYQIVDEGVQLLSQDGGKRTIPGEQILLRREVGQGRDTIVVKPDGAMLLWDPTEVGILHELENFDPETDSNPYLYIKKNTDISRPIGVGSTPQQTEIDTVHEQVKRNENEPFYMAELSPYHAQLAEYAGYLTQINQQNILEAGSYFRNSMGIEVPNSNITEIAGNSSSKLYSLEDEGMTDAVFLSRNEHGLIVSLNSMLDSNIHRDGHGRPNTGAIGVALYAQEADQIEALERIASEAANNHRFLRTIIELDIRKVASARGYDLSTINDKLAWGRYDQVHTPKVYSAQA